MTIRNELLEQILAAITNGGAAVGTDSVLNNSQVAGANATAALDALLSAAQEAVISGTEQFNDILLEQRDGSEIRISASPIKRFLQNLGQGITTPGGASISLTNLPASHLQFHPNAGNASRTYIALNAGLNDHAYFRLDYSRVLQDVTFETDQPFTQFDDGQTSMIIKAGHILTASAHLQNSSQPPSATNLLIIVVDQTAGDGAMSPRHNNTVYVNPTEGFDGANTDGNSRMRPYALLADGFNTLRGFTAGDHKQCVVDEETNLGTVNNNASGGYNVPNVALIAPACTVTSFSSLGHSFRGEFRRLDLATATDTAVISHNDHIEVDVISGIAGRSITFDTQSIGHATLKTRTWGTDITLDFSNLAAMNPGSVLRIEIDRYEGNLTTALGTLPTGVNLFIQGWIEDTMIRSNSQGEVYAVTLDDDGDLNTSKVGGAN